MPTPISSKTLIILPGLLMAAALALGTQSAHAGSETQAQTFGSAQEAVNALITAVKSGNVDEIVHVLGRDGRDLADSGDPVADQATRDRFITAYDEAHTIEPDGDARATLILGNDDFPFPIPVVAENGVWHFDTPAGAEEILARRIGENELAAIKSALTYVDAQREYGSEDRDGKGTQYARKFVSSDGRKDGLYWPTGEGEPESPLGPLIANARIEGYAAQSGQSEPFHGYFYRILTAQGPNAPGGAQDYLVNDRMIAGFALIAVPAEYDNSGIMTFIVNQDGVVLQKDLGPDTTTEAAKIEQFDPDPSWVKVEAP